MKYEIDYSNKHYIIYWAIIVALIATSTIAFWYGLAWKSEAEISQSSVKEGLFQIEQLNAEVDKANDIIRKRNTELQSARLEINRANEIIRKKDAELRTAHTRIDRSDTNMHQANQTIQQYEIALACHARKSNDKDIMSFIGNLIAPGVGGVIGSVLGQQQNC